MTTILTPRLRLEPYADAHLEQLYEMNSDLEVMRYITGKPETLEETRASIGRVQAASAQVMRRLGMTYRGVEQWHDEDVAVYGITRSEWQQRA